VPLKLEDHQSAAATSNQLLGRVIIIIMLPIKP
jgi:hypothetical protein